MRLAQEPARNREPFAQAGDAMLERGNVVGDLDDVIEWRARRIVQLEEHQVGQRGLRAFDLRREHGLAANIGIEEQVRLRQ